MKLRHALGLGVVLFGAAAPFARSAPPATSVGVTDEHVQKQIRRGREYAFALLRGGAGELAEGEDIAPLQAAHLRHLFGLKASGDVLLAGPLPDHPDLRGFVLFATADKEVARRLLAADPLVARGLLQVDVFTFFGIPGDRLR